MSTFVNTVDVVGDEALTNSILDRSITELDDNMVLNLCDNALRGCKSLTRLRMMSVTEIGEYACGYCEALKEIDFPLATAVSGYAFTNCLALEEVAFPAVETITGSYTFNNCNALKLVDLGAITTLGSSTFYRCPALETLILRTESVCSVSGISNVFYNTPISKGTGYIYVPAALVDSYKTASGWSTYAGQIRAIEDYPEICDPPSVDYVPFCSDGTTWTGESVTTTYAATGSVNKASYYRSSDISYSGASSVPVTEDTIVRLTVNGVEYVCTAGSTNDTKSIWYFTCDGCPVGLGGGDSVGDYWWLAFSAAGTYTVKVEVMP